LTDDLIHQALLDKRLDSLGDFHDGSLKRKLLASLEENTTGKKMKNADNVRGKSTSFQFRKHSSFPGCGFYRVIYLRTISAYMD
jgi:hypothetical protein